MDIETRKKISRAMKGKSNFEGKRHTHSSKIQIKFSMEGHRNAKDHKWVTDKESGEEHRVKGNLPKGMRWGRSRSSFNENFMDGRNPQDKGDMARHGLKGKTIAQLKKVRSSSTATARQKQLAHWYINMREDDNVREDLRKWFRERWVRMDTKGNIKGDCAREEGEGKPKCLPAAKAIAIGKEARAKAARRKRRLDPNPEREGKPINVATEETIIEKNVPTQPGKWSRAKALAKSKFDVYPSAYANGWAAKKYKEMGGSWKVEEGNDSAKRLEGTDSLRKIYTKATPGQGKTMKVDEAKATYCGRCGTTHVAPKFGGKCPALKEEHVNEVSKATLGSYVEKSHQDIVDRATGSSYMSGARGDKYNKAEDTPKEKKRLAGIRRALGKLQK